MPRARFTGDKVCLEGVASSRQPHWSISTSRVTPNSTADSGRLSSINTCPSGWRRSWSGLHHIAPACRCCVPGFPLPAPVSPLALAVADISMVWRVGATGAGCCHTQRRVALETSPAAAGRSAPARFGRAVRGLPDCQLDDLRVGGRSRTRHRDCARLLPWRRSARWQSVSSCSTRRLSRAQQFVFVLAAVAVAILTFSYGRVPWLALIIATTWVVYGYLKKHVPLTPVESMAAESFIVLGPAIMVVTAARRRRRRASRRPRRSAQFALVLCSGIATIVPLTLFAYAAQRMPLTVIGPLNYIVPTINFCLGWLVFHEALPAVAHRRIRPGVGGSGHRHRRYGPSFAESGRCWPNPFLCRNQAHWCADRRDHHETDHCRSARHHRRTGAVGGLRKRRRVAVFRPT